MLTALLDLASLLESASSNDSSVGVSGASGAVLGVGRLMDDAVEVPPGVSCKVDWTRRNWLCEFSGVMREVSGS